MSMIPTYIIIGYILLRIARFLFNYQNVYRLLGYKRISIAGNQFIIKKLQPLDFAENGGIPITFFQFKAGVTLMEQMRGVPKEDEAKQLKLRMEVAKAFGKVAIVYPKDLNIDDMFNSDSVKAHEIAWQLYGQILAHSFKSISKTYNMGKNQALRTAQLCETFGKKPHDHLFDASKLSVLEQHMIDEFIFNAWVEQKNREAKQK